MSNVSFDDVSRSGSPSTTTNQFPTTPRVTQTIIGDLKSSFLPKFMPPSGSSEYPYGMPTPMMINLQTNEFTYADNAMTIASPLNLQTQGGL